jgi:hypothetical protein
MKKILRFSPLIALAAPLLAAAQVPAGINISAITPYSNSIIYVINYILVPVLMAVAFIVFLWGVYKYFIYGAASDTERATGKQFTFWGVIGFVVILSLWGIVNLLMGTFGLSVGKAPPAPTIWGGSAPSGAGYRGSSATLGGTPAQNAALNQQFSNAQSICNADSTSLDCQAARAAYSASYYSVNSNPSATIDNAQTTAVSAGADCTYSPCASGLSCNYDANRGYSVCEAGTSGADTSSTDQYYNYTDTTTYGDDGFTP